MRNLSITKRLIIGFGLTALMIVIIALYSLAVSGMNTDEKIMLAAILAAAVILDAVICIAIQRSIVVPLNAMIANGEKLALGEVDMEAAMIANDDLGRFEKVLQKMMLSMCDQAKAAEQVATGDMTVKINVRSEKDILGQALARLVENNNSTLVNIAGASEHVALASKQLSDTSVILSDGAAQQASAIEELTASIEEIAAQTELNARNADEVNLLADDTQKIAVQGNSKMKDMLTAMEEINESSRNISKVIKAIDDIAFQTNILALNAAVEAARAGQYGKGFAVVAEEVRNLAARSAKAAEETTDMIENSIKKTQAGTKIAEHTADALGNITQGIEKVSSLVRNIATASNEQACGIEQINQGIMQVSQVVQANSATSEESAAASEELSNQAERLKETVDRFRLKTDSRNAYAVNANAEEMQATMSDKNTSSSKPRISLGEPEFSGY